MSGFSYLLFDTCLGRCGVAWGANGVRSVSFAHKDDDATRKQLFQRAADAVEAGPSDDIAAVISDINSLFEGEGRDLSHVPLDWEGIGDFEREVYTLSLNVKPGEVKTYGDLAKAMGDVAQSRRVGQALGRNPFPIIVPVTE